ncbi:MAG: hypothetical protein ACU85V_13625 [Gammaproteobacteria bacterium]
MRLRSVLLLLSLLGAGAVSGHGLNGSWDLDEAASEDFSDAARAKSDELNAARRERKDAGFARERQARSGQNRFQSQVDATERMIEEDSRSVEWASAPELRIILEAENIRLHADRKVVVLYDGEQRRLLTINPAGRAYSVSGTEITIDEVGRSLTYFEGDTLVIETAAYAGGDLVERYTAAGADRLLQEVTRRESSDGPSVTVRREFRRR